ncbi:hypothetical protein A3D00_01415 [Candidatus Woesebacteria bacterium RIFCSPHIGHO2_02_FULL_38_9]|uniref:DNA helicase UvrD n=1 Tax=Candidatus Woesebacteria bacterium RIFCSPHIGHO2_01_FULL_39_28 TaxID=1802496 RepID=A0A1F7YHA3_9BACT|nr:MAG: hypothetical protein A2627_04030 [Candidatus Woesebacteria bacterium RIFCSPHIGHO2_01_FULL_39_28]OGM34692.1 MAG: hypothetical protein A3D00_01415 [Candidatus Woesebacteria bacterium RIFCSPHIGHO2_02_FULL_38_9]OGM58664.1 MAG: hypothetical protein A3A50_02685 [Candidatus Woesebacteria bacterium RIFCSPLOWO2_01_FULL_38_20]
MKVIADLEVHSKYARAVSPQMNISTISQWARRKGIDLVGTGDFTHPMWLRELEAGLKEDSEGIYKFNNQKFLLTSEVSCIYSHNGKGRRVHLLIYLPTFDKVHKFNDELTRKGANLFSDGRPIIGLSLAQVVEIVLTVESKAIIIPAHVWTPWFGFYGAMSGYDHLDEAFGNLARYIYAVETGLSSDPAMNWTIEELKNRSIVSFSDAHSPAKLGREATIFEIPEISYENIFNALKQSKIAYTIEFYPEEGKYHYSGHRNCKVVYSPKDSKTKGNVCPVCGKNLTSGVMSRVKALTVSDIESKNEADKFGVRWMKDRKGKRPPYVMLVPLLEIIAESLHSTVSSQKVMAVYDRLINSFSNEFEILLKTNLTDLKRITTDRVVEGVKRVRSGDIVIDPGYDGVFGKVKIWKTGIDQETLF